MARRQNRANNIGMRSVSGPARPYGICPVCGRNKPMHWTSKTEYYCYDCLKGREVKDPVPFPSDNPYSAVGRHAAAIGTGRTIKFSAQNNQKKHDKVKEKPPQPLPQEQEGERLPSREIQEKAYRLWEQQKKSE
jgi:hypothetical protein